jgi:altronate dehydratase small subunit
MDMPKAIMMEEKDNVATLITTIDKGHQVQIEVGEKKITVQAIDQIPYGHKIALKDIIKGEEVIKYGEVIGRSTDHIREGSHVHIHNIESLSLGNL